MNSFMFFFLLWFFLRSASCIYLVLRDFSPIFFHHRDVPHGQPARFFYTDKDYTLCKICTRHGNRTFETRSCMANKAAKDLGMNLKFAFPRTVRRTEGVISETCVSSSIVGQTTWVPLSAEELHEYDRMSSYVKPENSDGASVTLPSIGFIKRSDTVCAVNGTIVRNARAMTWNITETWQTPCHMPFNASMLCRQLYRAAHHHHEHVRADPSSMELKRVHEMDPRLSFEYFALGHPRTIKYYIHTFGRNSVMEDLLNHMRKFSQNSRRDDFVKEEYDCVPDVRHQHHSDDE